MSPSLSTSPSAAPLLVCSSSLARPAPGLKFFKTPCGRLAQEELIGLSVWVLDTQGGIMPLHASVGHVNILVPIVVEVRETDSETCVGKAGFSQTHQGRRVFKTDLGVAIEGVGFAVQMGHKKVQISIAFDIHAADAHARFGHPVSIDCASGDQGLLGEGAVAPIDPELVGHSIVGHVEVHQSVTVVIPGGDPETVPEGCVQTCLPTDVGESTVSVVAVQGVARVGLIVVGTAVISKPPRGNTVQFMLRRPVDVVNDEKVEIAVIVIVDKSTAGSPGGIPDSGCFSGVGKGSLAVILVEHVGSQVGHVQVDVAVIVIVAAGTAHAVAPVTHARCRGHIFEGSVAPVAVESIGAVLGHPGTQRITLKKIDIEKIIPIKVAQPDTAEGNLREEVFPLLTRVLDQVDSRPLCDLLKPGFASVIPMLTLLATPAPAA